MNTAPYSALAPYYDWVMNHVDYREWARYVDNQIKCHRPRARKILEVAAGTCPLSNEPIARRRDFIYSDRSLPMLLSAVSPVKRVQCDFLNLPFKKKFDACVMIYDSINYLLRKNLWIRGFRQAHQVLKTGGLLLFDISTEVNSREFFSGEVSLEDREDCHISRESRYDKKSKLQYNEFTIFVKTSEGTFKKFKETHVQRLYQLSDVKKMLKTSPFKVLEILDEFSLDKAHARSQRIHFILEAA